MIPEYFEGKLTSRCMMELGGFGTAHIAGCVQGQPDQLINGVLTLTMHAPKVRVYDIWAMVDGGWVQLNRMPGDAESWGNESLIGQSIECLRLWVGAAWDMTLEPALPRLSAPNTPRLDGSQPDVQPYVPVVEGEPPLPSTREEKVELHWRLKRWMVAATEDVVVAALLEEWTEACAEAAALGWMVGLPRGEDLFEVYARTAGGDARLRDHDQCFARWLVTELGRATRAGLLDRRELEARRPGVRRLHQAVARVLRALSDDLAVTHVPPPVVGASVRHEWLVDESLAARLDNPVVVSGSHRPIFVLRPMLSRDRLVLVEGEVV